MIGLTNIRLNKYSLERKKIIFFGVAVLIIIALGVLLKVSISSFNNSQGLNDQRYNLPAAKKQVRFNKEFAFPLKNDKGEEVSKLKYTIENAELRDQIVIQGKKASSVKGRTFLIINLKLGNEYEKPIEINTKDYIRLSANGNDSEWLAPDIHNDPVTVQAISTKYTRVGFPINDTDKNLRLRIGEINGEKQVVEIKF